MINGKITPSQGSLTTSNKRVTEGSKFNFKDDKLNKKQSTPAISFSSRQQKNNTKPALRLSNLLPASSKRPPKPLYSPQNSKKTYSIFGLAATQKQISRKSINLKKPASLIPTKIPSQEKSSKAQAGSPQSLLEKESVETTIKLNQKRLTIAKAKEARKISGKFVSGDSKIKSEDPTTDNNTLGITKLIKKIKSQNAQN